MKISTKSRYALRLMLDIAVNSYDNYISLKEISNRQNISIKYLEQIVSLLNNAGYLKSIRGSKGGYTLSKPPREYIVGEILRAVDGEVIQDFCRSGDTICTRSDKCITVDFWQGLNKTVNEYVDNFTLEDLIKNKQKRLQE